MDKISIIGLGYVGLPLAHAFSEKYQVVGFDVNLERVKELRLGNDRTLELTRDQLKEAIDHNIIFTTDINDAKDCNIYIVTVPTPINEYKQPDLTPLYKASEIVGKVLNKENIVIYESTVFPGCTEDECVPVLEKISKLKFNEDFFCGYSPERINPGDREHTVKDIKKVTSGSTQEAGKKVDELYKTIIKAGTHLASCIKVAEAAKVIENAQRDLNIAFVNELSKIFNIIGIDTAEVLEAAATKWNFLPFKPGLVGGHCIGVDPYYLTHKAQAVGYHSQIILAGRRLNDGMGKYIANEVVKLMIKKEHKILGANILVLGITFKENCPDIRNSKVIDIVNELKDFECNVDVYDPWADKDEVKHEYGIDLQSAISNQQSAINYDAVILAVGHNQFKNLNLKDFTNKNAVIYDVKSFLDKDIVDKRL